MLITEARIKELPTSSLAYIGDGTYELAVRLRILGQGRLPSSALHARAVYYVKASSQARLARYLYSTGFFEKEEEAVFLRARNAKISSIAKHASLIDYKMATAFEAVIGYLKLLGRKERLSQVLEQAFAYLESEQEA